MSPKTNNAQLLLDTNARQLEIFIVHYLSSPGILAQLAVRIGEECYGGGLEIAKIAVRSLTSETQVLGRRDYSVKLLIRNAPAFELLWRHVKNLPTQLMPASEIMPREDVVSAALTLFREDVTAQQPVSPLR